MRPFLHECPAILHRAGIHIGSGDFPLHHHDMWEVIYQRTGHVNTQQESDVIEMSPGMVLVHPPGVHHADIASTPYALYFLHISIMGVPHWPRICHDDPHQSIGRICESLCREFVNPAIGRDLMLQLLTVELDVLLSRAYEEQKQVPGQRIVAEAQRLLEERYRERIRMNLLAEEIGVSRSTLYTHFTELRGQTPPDYLLAVRLRHAIGLLHHSDLTLDAIAERCGFNSASHLSRHIKSATGCTPGSLRKASDPASVRKQTISSELNTELYTA